MSQTRRRTWILPGLNDVRWFQLAFLLSFDAFALTSPGFKRTPAEFAACILTCVLLDIGVTVFKKGVYLFPISGLISALGLLLLCDSPRLWAYPLVAALSILSKHLIRFDGKHIFNPTDFGLVCALLFFNGEVTIKTGRWGGSLATMSAVGLLGLLTVYRAGRLDVAAAWVLTFVAGAFVRHWITGAAVVSNLSPMTGAAFMLFTFFMMTDPMTTPETPRGRWVYGVALGVLDGVLRFAQSLYSPFYALFLLSGFLPLLRQVFSAPVPERVWKPVEFAWKESPR